MTLQELSYEYKAQAELLAGRIRALKAAARGETDPERRIRLERRAAELRPLQQQARELAELTALYYDRRYHKNGKYTL